MVGSCNDEANCISTSLFVEEAASLVDSLLSKLAKQVGKK